MVLQVRKILNFEINIKLLPKSLCQTLLQHVIFQNSCFTSQFSPLSTISKTINLLVKTIFSFMLQCAFILLLVKARVYTFFYHLISSFVHYYYVCSCLFLILIILKHYLHIVGDMLVSITCYKIFFIFTVILMYFCTYLISR